MNNQTDPKLLAYYDELAKEYEEIHMQKEKSKNETEKIMYEFELDGIPMTSCLTYEEAVKAQAQMLKDAEELRKQVILESAKMKMDFAYKYPGLEVELTHEEAKLVDPYYPFDDDGNEVD